MSQLTIRNELLTALIAVSTVPIAYENSSFDPTSVDTFISTHFIPATSEPMGKLQTAKDDDRGVFQVSVFIRLNPDDDGSDTEQLALIDTLKQTFFDSAIIGSVYINEVTLNGGYIVESHYKRDLSINYMNFTSRT
jgi:hypothetical protein